MLALKTKLYSKAVLEYGYNSLRVYIIGSAYPITLHLAVIQQNIARNLALMHFVTNHG